eukprot:TRINITY_DN1259_c3_g1_i2.p2 TRINITY_DN1259_c3_g1~~TRINITY_DN1259_c3_g1_i2.p2  ORF type:complete len:268 (-),score=37.43 TRINITY_DN1259_c3_g1_i2:251-1054(-)
MAEADAIAIAKTLGIASGFFGYFCCYKVGCFRFQMQEAQERRKRLRALQQQIEQEVLQQPDSVKPAGQQISLQNPFAQEQVNNNRIQAPMMQSAVSVIQQQPQPAFQPQIQGLRGANQPLYNQPRINPLNMQINTPYQPQNQMGFGMISSRPQQLYWNQQQQQQQQFGIQIQMQQQQQQQMQQLLQQQIIIPQDQYFGQQFQGGQVFSGKGGQKRKGGDWQRGGRNSPRPQKSRKPDNSKLGNDFKTIEKHFFSHKFLEDPWKHFKK